MVGPDAGLRLERSCKVSAASGLAALGSAAPDVLRAAPLFPGIERIEARFRGEAFVRHRHDTYALGLTLGGVQTFWYRGRARASLPGQVIVLHPDEIHDGGAGGDEGLLYRMLYLEPRLLRAALGAPAAGLPFVADPVVEDAALRAALAAVLDDLEGPLDPLAVDRFVAALADALGRHAGLPTPRAPALDAPALTRVRAYLDASAEQDAGGGEGARGPGGRLEGWPGGGPVRSEALEAVSGLDRYSLARQFKALFGTSPYRYLLMRRLARGRRLLAAGQPIAEAAAATGFADQSHFHRHFVKAFGLTPGRWRQLVRR